MLGKKGIFWANGHPSDALDTPEQSHWANAYIPFYPHTRPPKADVPWMGLHSPLPAQLQFIALSQKASTSGCLFFYLAPLLFFRPWFIITQILKNRIHPHFFNRISTFTSFQPFLKTILCVTIIKLPLFQF